MVTHVTLIINWQRYLPINQRPASIWSWPLSFQKGNNMKLSRYFGPEWAIACYVFNGITYYPGFMVMGLLGLKNSTNAIRGKVSNRNRIMEKVEGVNQRRSIHLITFEGALELIIRSNTPEAIRIKAYLVNSVIFPNRRDLRYRSALTDINSEQ